MSYSPFRRLPQPLGLRGALPVLCAAVGLGASACATEPPEADHTHQIELAAGDFVRAVVEQRADVRVELLDPDGREILHVDGPYGIREDEELAAVVERAGLYRLKVRSCPQGAPPADCYTLRLDPPRPPAGADHRRAEAVRATQNAVDAMATGKAETLPFQRAARRRALALWRSLGERRREAEELYQLGVIQRLLQQLEPAAERLHEAAAIYAELGEPANEAKALNEAGMSTEERDLEKAAEDFRRALEKARAARDRNQEGLILNNLGRVQSRLGRHEEAAASLEEALELFREIGHEPLQCSVLINLAALHERLSEPDRAAELYNEALALAGDLDGKANALNNLAAVQEDLGNRDEALRLYTQALEILRQQQNGSRTASVLNNIAVLHMSLGQLDQALAAFQEAFAQARDAGNLVTQVHALSNLGFLYRKMGRTREALASWRQVAPLVAERQDLRHVSLAARAAVAEEEGRLDAARDLLSEGIAWSRRQGLWQWEADMTSAITRIERRRGNLEAALLHIESAVESIESIRSRLGNPEGRALFLGGRQAYYESWIETLMELHSRHPASGYDTRALQVSERARARSLLDLLGEADIYKGVDPRLLDKERRLRAALRERDRESMELAQRAASPESLAAAAGRLQKAIADYEQLETELRASSRSYAALTQPQPLTTHKIQQQLLGDRTLLLEIALGEKRSYLWAVTRDTAQSFELPGRQEIEEAALAFYGAVTEHSPEAGAKIAHAKVDSTGRTLSGMILRDVEHLLGDKILLVVSDGVLQYIPFAALPLPSSPAERLVARNQVVNLPSASTLAALRRQIERRPPAPGMLAVLADPIFADDPRRLRIPSPKSSQAQVAARRGPDQLRLLPLPFAREEATNILAFVPAAGQRLAALDFDATYALATSGRLAEYRYVHFATHGLLDSQQPKLSKLALSQYHRDGRPQDESFLRLADIYNLELNADLVTLSACRTALGKEVRGEGLIGLTRGFMYAGAARVLASLWSVEDKATADLMERFYRYLLVERRPAADALRRAQLDLIRKPKYQSPYHWAGFSLQGEWK